MKRLVSMGAVSAALVCLVGRAGSRSFLSA
jgi:hypothetical protein